MGRLDGKVAIITGGARGQGRAHAIRLAEEGAEIVVSDVAAQLTTVPYPMSTEDDLAETVRQVEGLDRRCVSVKADARSAADCARVADAAMSEFGRIDILSVNHGIANFGGIVDTSEELWDEMIDTNLKGVWQSVKAVVPHMVAGGRGGAITLTSSVAGIKAYYGTMAYGAAKHGVIGLMKVMAAELGPHMIRVNAICPATVNTPMVDNDLTIGLFTGGKPGTMEDIKFASQSMNLMPVPWCEARDISNALLWLSSDEARYVTGLAVTVDMGLFQQPSGIPPEVGALLAPSG